jgi:hypothetical protein
MLRGSAATVLNTKGIGKWSWVRNFHCILGDSVASW